MVGWNINPDDDQFETGCERTIENYIYKKNGEKSWTIEKKWSLYKMASIAIMIGGAVLNAAAFTGGNYLAKYIAGDSGQAALAKKTRHDKALEAYQAINGR